MASVSMLLLLVVSVWVLYVASEQPHSYTESQGGAIASEKLHTSKEPHRYEHPKNAFALHRLSIELQSLPPIILKTDAEHGWEGQAVTVTWEGVLFPRENDIIAVYVPAHADPKLTVPAMYINATDEEGQYLKNGSGSATVHLTNMRQSFGFKLIKGGFQSPKVVAEAKAVRNLLHTLPTSGHLSLKADGRGMVVQWVSSSNVPQLVRYTISGVSETAMDQHPGSVLMEEHESVRVLSLESLGRKMIGDMKSRSATASIVKEGSSSAAWHHVISSSLTYDAADMCGPPATTSGWMDPGFIHTAVIEGAELPSNQRFFYQYGSEEVGWSQIRSAITPPRLGSKKPFKFLAFNDVAMTNPLLFDNKCYPNCPKGLHFNNGYGENSSKIVHFLENERNAQLAILVGDLAYAVGYAPDWDVFGQQFESAFTSWPLMVGTGNHERDYPGSGDAFHDTAYDSGGECNVPFVHRYYMPTRRRSPAGSGGAGMQVGDDEADMKVGIHVEGTEMGDDVGESIELGKKKHWIPGRPDQDPNISYFSFEMGSVHFLILDSEIATEPDSAQGRFVAEDLASVNRSVTPWVVAAMHRMMLAPATWRKEFVGDLDNMERLQNDFEDVFNKYGVDIVVQGHEHAYARSCMYFKGECVDKDQGKTDNDPPQHAPVYILAGHAGAGFTHGFPSTLPPWVEVAYESSV